MQIIPDVVRADLAWCRPRVREAILTALHDAPTLMPGVCYSVGPILTFVVDRADERAQTYLPGESGEKSSQDAEYFTARRRYWTLLVAMKERIEVECAARTTLTTIYPYDDTTDREYMSGSGQLLALDPGQALAVWPDEAVRIHPSSGLVLEMRVTVEGNDLRR